MGQHQHRIACVYINQIKSSKISGNHLKTGNSHLLIPTAHKNEIYIGENTKYLSIEA